MKAADLPLQYNAVDILEHNLDERGDKVALYGPERSLTFREVSSECNRVGNALRKLDVRQGEYVGILSPDCPEWVTSFFGCLKIGAVAVGMNTLLNPPEYAYILNDSRARVLIVHESLLSHVEAIPGDQPFLKHVVVIGQPGARGQIAFSDWTGGESDDLTPAPTHREDFCTLNYSSGTSGEPKGILHAHKDFPLTNQLWGVNLLGVRESDRTFSVPKLFFTYGLIANLTVPWSVGASNVLLTTPARQMKSLLEAIDHFKPTVFFGVPTAYAAMLAVEDFEHYDLSSIRLCVSAGEILPAPLWESWKEKTGLELLDSVGTTENLALFLSNRPGDIRPGSSGKPIEGFELKVVDELDKEVPRGEIGNLVVKSETASLSYLHQYDRSRQSFRGEWLFTGDKYCVDEEGFFWYFGRSDDMLKVGGIWVSPHEIESTLLSHPAVLECAVIGQPDESNLVKPKGYVVLKRDYQPSEGLAQELIAYCKENMATYKRPRWIAFMDELPKTATGKIQRAKLRGEVEPSPARVPDAGGAART